MYIKECYEVKFLFFKFEFRGYNNIICVDPIDIDCLNVQPMRCSNIQHFFKELIIFVQNKIFAFLLKLNKNKEKNPSSNKQNKNCVKH